MEGMTCYVHSDQPAAGICVLCGKPICAACIVDVEGKNQCKACVSEVITTAKQAPAKPKSAGAAAFLSFIIAGVGQLYNGQVARGLVIIFIAVASLPFFPYSLFWLMPIWLFAILDAYAYAKRFNRGEVG